MIQAARDLFQYLAPISHWGSRIFITDKIFQCSSCELKCNEPRIGGLLIINACIVYTFQEKFYNKVHLHVLDILFTAVTAQNMLVVIH